MSYLVSTENFVDKLVNLGVEEVVGVPCSTMTYFINECIKRKMYTSYVNEGDAVAYAAGRNIEGKIKVAVILQNSGLTNASSPISSLTSLYNIPMLYFVGYRGAPGTQDEPQHQIIGPGTRTLIRTITGGDCEIMTLESFDKRVPFVPRQQFVLVKKGQFTPSILEEESPSVLLMSRYDVIKEVKKLAQERDDVVVLTTTGYTSREMMSLGEDFNRNFYMFGSMGCLISFASGIAKSHPEKKVIVIDGDGSALMRLEGSFTPDKYHLKNLLRIIIKNNSHQSTGGQKISDSNKVFTIELMTESGETTITTTGSLNFRLKRFIRNGENPTIVARVNSECPDSLPRPTLTPEEIKCNFIEGLNL